MLAIVGGTVYTASDIIKDGIVLIDQGKVLAVAAHIAIPYEAEVIYAQQKIITPGFIDCHTHLGLAEEAAGDARLDKNEVNDPVCPHLRAIDAINPADPGLADAYSAGTTAVIATPGSENVIGGQSVAIKTYGQVLDHMILRHPAGLKIALGENPIRMHMAKQQLPSTRMGIAGIIRENFIKALEYQKKLTTQDMPRDLRLEALCMVLDKKIPLRAHAHAADDIMTAIRIADEFDVKLTIEHATAAHTIAPELASRSIPAIVGPSITARVKVELKERTYKTPVLLHQAGVKIALASDHPFLPAGSLRLEAALAMREGLPREQALKAITLHAAEIAGIDDRVGSLSPGKDGDVVIFSDDPFAISSRVELVLINGKVVYQAAAASLLYH